MTHFSCQSYLLALAVNFFFPCMYCKKLQTKFARHLETVHKNEAEVKKFILLPKGKYNNLYTYYFKSNAMLYISLFKKKYFITISLR